MADNNIIVLPVVGGKIEKKKLKNFSLPQQYNYYNTHTETTRHNIL